MLIIAVISSIAIYLIPTIIYNMAGIHNGWIRYVILFLLVLLAGIQYANAKSSKNCHNIRYFLSSSYMLHHFSSVSCIVFCVFLSIRVWIL